MYHLFNERTRTLSTVHHPFAMGHFSGGFDKYFEMFKEKRLNGGDVFEHTAKWWRVRLLDNVFITMYEEMKRDLEGVVLKVAKFLGMDVADEHIIFLSSFSEMKMNEFVSEKVLVDAEHFDLIQSTLI